LGTILVFGLGLRFYHYVRDPSMWHDEAALVLNVLGKSYGDLFGPLFFSEACPPLFLWLEKAVTGLLGDGTYALRLVPFLASCLSLVAMAVVARRLLGPTGAIWVVLLFACSDRLLWHACEAKPYAVDVLVASGLLLALIQTQTWPVGRQLLLFSGLSPFLVFLSYPACFLLGGLALSLLPVVARAGRRSDWFLFGLFVLAMGVSFGLLLAGPIRVQRDATILECWSDMFPSWDQPWTVPGWLAARLPEVFRYAYEPVGNVLGAVAVVGAVVLWRGGQRRLLAFLLLPVALTCLAALLGRYPLGASRVVVFAAPAAMLLIGAGLPAVLAYLRRHSRLAALVVVGIVLFPVAQGLYRVGCTWERADSAGAADYVRVRYLPGEMVVGTSWEHGYYFRAGPGTYCFFSATLRRLAAASGNAGPQVGGLWFLATGKTAQERERALAGFAASGDWRVLSRAEFPQTTVYYMESTHSR
jgi:hypothetical protein